MRQSQTISKAITALQQGSFWKYTALILAALFVVSRLINLSADPPAGISTSQAVYTDPAAYTLSARNAEIFDNSDPLEDDRFPLFQYSAVAGLARVVFSFGGASYALANLTGLLFSFATALLVFLITVRFAGLAAGAFTLLFLLVNQNQFHFGRLPFLENAMVFFGVLAFWILGYCQRRPWLALLAGIALAAAFCFGKTHGLVFVGVFLFYFLWSWLSEREPRELLLRQALWLTLGAVALTGVWYFTIGADSLETISAYLGQQSTGLYGAPKAFTSVSEFYSKLISLGTVRKLFFGMPVVSLLALISSLWIIRNLIYSKATLTGKDRVAGNAGAVTAAVVFFLLWFTLTYLELFPWNYRPLRYQIPLIYPLCALAGIGLSRLWEMAQEPRKLEQIREGVSSSGLWRAGLWGGALFVILNIPAYELWSRDNWLRELFNSGDMLSKQQKLYWSPALAALVALAVYLAQSYRQFIRRALKISAPVVALALVIASLTVGVRWYKDWLIRPTFMTVAVSQDLPKVLGEGAVLAGPYGVGLCQDNSLPVVIHMFGVSDPDTSFFERFPVTHLLLDGSNKTRFEKMHPAVAAGSEDLGIYHITNRKVYLMRVAGVTGNVAADSYQLSPYERGRLVLQGRLEDSSGALLAELRQLDTINIAANRFLADIAQEDERLEEAKMYLERAISATPTDFNIWADLGQIYLRMYVATENRAHRAEAIRCFRRALYIRPQADKVQRALAAVESS